MAKITDTSLNWFGSKYNARQMRIAVPGGPSANTGGMLFLECIDNAGAASGGLYLFTDGTNLRVATSAPSNTNTGGDALTTATGGATTALSNLASVAINTTLVSDTANTDDIGSDTVPWKSAYFRTSIVFDNATRNLTLTASEPASSARTVNFGDPGGNDSVAYLAASQALTNKTYEGLTIACASANQMVFTRGTATITLTEGNTDILLNAGAQIDIAAAKTLHLDTNLTVNTVDVTLNQALASTSSPTFNALTVTSLTDGTATLTGGALSTTGSVTCRGITNTNTAASTTAELNIHADNVNATFGASDSTDSKIYFNGTSLCFWDSETTTTYTLKTLATGTTLNPSVTGDLTILDGKFDWTNATDEVSATWDFANTTNNCINATPSHLTTGTFLNITSTTVAGGIGLRVNFTEAVPLTGSYIQCANAGSAVFDVKRYGAVTIAGSAAGTAAMTLTSGDVVMSAGRLTQTTTADVSNTFARNNATGTNAVVSIQDANATGGTTLLVNSDCTDGNDALQVTHDGTGYGLSVIGTAVTGIQALFQGPSSQTTSSVVVDGTTGAWIGANGVGMLHLKSDGALAHAGSSLLYVAYTGAIAAIDSAGTCAQFIDTGAAGTHVIDSFAVGVSSTNNSGLKVSTSAAGSYGLVVAGPSAQTASMVLLDGTATNGWGGAANTGMLHLTLDGATLSTSASAIQVVIGTGTPTDASLGYVFKIADTVTAPATPQSTYAMYASTVCNSMFLTSSNVACTTLTLDGTQAKTAPILTVSGSTGTGWDGASNVGMVNIVDSGTHVHVNASCVYIAHSGAGLASNLGSSLRINDSSTAAAGAYVAYMTSASNSVLNLVTAATGKSALVITGPASQTASAVTIGSASIGWVGAPATGLLQLDSNGALVADASLIKATNATQPAVANDGICAEFIDTGNAQATSYVVRIASTNNEALHVDTGLAVFDEGPLVQYSASAATDTAPKIAELNTAFGITAAAAYNGFVGVLYDNTGATGGYLCWVANGAWYYEEGALAGA